MAKLNNKTAEQPPLLHVNDDPTVQKLEAELAQFQARLADDTARLEQAARDLARAQDDLDTTESKLLAGRTDEQAFAAAQARLAECKRAHALALHAREDAERMVRLLPAALVEARIAAKKQVVSNLRARYAVQLADLKAALQAAVAANKALYQTYALAHAELPANVPYPHLPGTWMVEDLGDAVTLAAGRLTNLAFAPLIGIDDRQLSQAELWMREADAVLADMASWAERDTQALAARIAYEPERQRRDAEKAALELAFARRDLAQYSVFYPSTRGTVPPPPPPREE